MVHTWLVSCASIFQHSNPNPIKPFSQRVPMLLTGACPTAQRRRCHTPAGFSYSIEWKRAKRWCRSEIDLPMKMCQIKAVAQQADVWQKPSRELDSVNTELDSATAEYWCRGLAVAISCPFLSPNKIILVAVLLYLQTFSDGEFMNSRLLRVTFDENESNLSRNWNTNTINWWEIDYCDIFPML